MKHTLVVILFLAFGLSACGAQATPAPVQTGPDGYVSPNLDVSYEGALAVRNQLSMGVLELVGTPNAVTAEQAGTLLPLFQALLSTQKSSTAAEAEVNALLEQIEASLTSEQLVAIRGMQLTQTNMQEWAAASGITLGSGGGQPGQGQGLSPEERATRQAQEGRTPSSSGSTGGAATALLTAVIDYLDGLAS